MLSPYLLQENDEYSFEFITETGIRYKVYFLDYSFMFAEYTDISCTVYSFNIDSIEGDPDNSLADERVGLTISEIISLFFHKINNMVVYVCDRLDQRQYARKRKFDLWFYLYNDGSLIKEDGLAVTDGVEIYNSMLLHKQNSQLTEIIPAFKELNERQVKNRNMHFC